MLVEPTFNSVQNGDALFAGDSGAEGGCDLRRERSRYDDPLEFGRIKLLKPG
jgi:hypothetical protein